jgi:dipicolinate synthase subunit B
MKNKKILFGISGSFCNHSAVLKQLKILCKKNDVEIIVSENVYKMNTRFHSAASFLNELEEITHHRILYTISDAEAIGPRNEHDLMIIAPMSATVCAKITHGIYDHPIALATKAMLRNQKKIVFGFASNDGLSISSMNLMTLLNRKHFYSIPFYQDDEVNKPHSLISKWELLEDTCDAALENRQLQPILWR